MTAPTRLHFDSTWLQQPAVAAVPGTPGWITVAHELNRTHQRNGTRTATLVRGFGCGPSPQAHLRATGELVERFGASDPRVIQELDLNQA